MSRWTPDEHGCIYDEAGCFARLTPNKAERLAKRHNADIDALTAERDRLATENAELRRRLTRSIISADLAAANATLDRLREAVPEGDDNPEEWPYGNGPGCVRQLQAILYPPNLLSKMEINNDLG